MAANNYKDLEKVQTRTLAFEQCQFQVTFNPGRIRSTAAKTDTRSIQERACFLCGANRPKEQKGIEWANRYTILINPFPIFKHHLTLPDNRHTAQELDAERVNDLLTLSRSLPGFTFFYNGPKCGASAPDHFHFQAGERNYMPVEKEIKEEREKLFETEELSVYAKNNYIRQLLVVESNCQAKAVAAVMQIREIIGQVVPQEPEPMLNMLVFHEDDNWKICLFPRRAHRPSQYFEEGEQKIVFSPGAVDFGGVIILPREEDFKKLTKASLSDMFCQVSFSETQFHALKEKILNLDL